MGCEDVHSYSENQIRDALEERGLVHKNLTKDEMAKKLDKWVTFSMYNRKRELVLLNLMPVDHFAKPDQA
jgi:hypothetical protein